MATITGTLKAMSGKWFPRKFIRASKAFAYVPFEINGPPDYSGSPLGTSMYGVVWLNKASLVGSGGTTFTISDSSSTIVITE